MSEGECSLAPCKTEVCGWSCDLKFCSVPSSVKDLLFSDFGSVHFLTCPRRFLQTLTRFS